MPLYHPEPTSDDEEEEKIPFYKRKPPKPVMLHEMEEFLKHPPKPPPSQPQDTTLWMQDRHLEDAHIKVLAEHVEKGHFDFVEVMHLAHNPFGPKGMGLLAVAMGHGNMPKIYHLNIGYVNLGVEGGRAFASLLHAIPLLQQLEVNYNNLMDDGAKAIFDEGAKGHLKTMSYLYMKGNGFADGAMEAFCEAFKSGKMESLIHCVFGENDVGDEGMLCLANGIEDGDFAKCRHIDMSPARNVGVDGKEVIENVIKEYSIKPLHVIF
jgi:hypothetical protein